MTTLYFFNGIQNSTTQSFDIWYVRKLLSETFFRKAIAFTCIPSWIITYEVASFMTQWNNDSSLVSGCAIFTPYIITQHEYWLVARDCQLVCIMDYINNSFYSQDKVIIHTMRPLWVIRVVIGKICHRTIHIICFNIL